MKTLLYFTALVAIVCLYFPHTADCEKNYTWKVGMVGAWQRIPETSALYSHVNLSFHYINNYQTKILPNVRMEQFVWNTNAVVSSAIVGTVNAIEWGAQLFIGSAYTPEQEAISQVAGYFGTPHIDGIASGVGLSNKQQFPYFMRTVPSDSGQCAAIIKFIARNGWKKFTVVYEDSDFGISGKDTLTQLGYLYNMTTDAVQVQASASSGGTNDKLDYTIQAQQVKKSDARIVVAYLNPTPGWYWAKAAYQVGFYGPDIVHIVSQSIVLSIDTPTGGQNNDPLFIPARQAVFTGAIGITPEPFGSGELYEDYKAFFLRADKTTFPGVLLGGFGSYALFMFDSVYLPCLALHNLLQIQPNISKITGPMLAAQMRNTTFHGVSGYVSLDENGDRLGYFGIRTITNTTNGIVEYYDSVTGEFFAKPNSTFTEYVYANGLTTPPYDSAFVCPCIHGTCVDRDPTCTCIDGWSGVKCEIFHTTTDNGNSGVLIPAIIAPIGFVVLVGAIAAYVIYNRKRKQFVKEMVEKQRSDVPRSDIVLNKRIGRGASGEVFTAQFRGTEVAVKRLVAKGMSKNIIQEFQLESAVMCSLRHPNVVLFMGSCYDQTQQEMLLVMEFMSRGSLYNVLHDLNISVPFELQLHMAYQTAQGINFLHQSSPPILHCDIKSHNVLLDDKWNARISDFGITRLVKMANTKGDTKEEHSSVGTIFWTAPEVLEGNPFTEQSDCYAFGIVLWEIFHRQDPYAGKDPVVAALEVVRSGLRPAINSNVPSDIKEIMQQCWSPDPSQRPPFQEIVQKLRQLTIKNPIYNYGTTQNRTDPPTGMIYYVSTNVYGAYELWDEHPEEMKEAMILHNKLLRANLQQYSGYEVTFAEHGFEVAFGQLEDAMNWCILAQASLMHLQWPQALLTHANAAPKSQSGTLSWNGLRVSMAINKGLAQCERDPVSLHMNYSGATVEKTATILGGSPSGFIVVAAAVHTEIKDKKITFIEPVEGAKFTSVKDAKTQKAEQVYVYTLSSLDRQLPTRSEPIGAGEALPHTVVNIGVSDVYEESVDYTPEKKPTIPSWLIKWEDLEVKEAVGKGRVGEVFAAKLGGKDVAVKVLFNQKFAEEEMFQLKVLASMAAKMHHPNVVPFHGVVVLPPNIAIVTEFRPKGSLYDVLTAGTFAGTKAAKVKIAADIARGMQYIRKQASFIGVHRDFKSPNVLIGANGDIKVADFGLTSLYDVSRTLTSIGLVTWTAPELMSGEVLDNEEFRADIYAFGIVLWELWTQQRPYDKIHPIKLVSKVFDGFRPEIPADCPYAYNQLITQCWVNNPHDRPTWDEIISKLENM